MGMGGFLILRRGAGRDNIGRKIGTGGPLPQREAQRTTLTAAKISLGFPIRHKTKRKGRDHVADIYSQARP